MLVNRTGIVLSPNNRRVVLRPFELSSDDRKLRIIARVSTLAEDEVDAQVSHVFEEFHGRHQRAREFFLSRYKAIRHYLLTDAPLTENRQLLLGAYFTQEYALESAALFNPSIVWHPNQSNLAAGSRRFVLSLPRSVKGTFHRSRFAQESLTATTAYRSTYQRSLSRRLDLFQTHCMRKICFFAN